MAKTKTILIISLLLLFLQDKVVAQNFTSLDDVLAFTTQDDFIAHNIYKVISQNFSKDGSLEVVIEGDISDPTFSLAIVSMLPALQKRTNKKSLEFKYSNLNEKNFEEALIIESVRHLHPELFLDYLITRSECLFETPWINVLQEMNIDVGIVSKHIQGTPFVKKVKKNFGSNADKDTRFSVNQIEFIFLREFYLSIDDLYILDNFFKDEKCDYINCLSRAFNLIVQGQINRGVLEEADFKEEELNFSQQDIYVAIIASITSNENTFLALSSKIIDPLDFLTYYLNVNNYKILSNTAKNTDYIKRCKEEPCFFY